MFLYSCNIINATELRRLKLAEYMTHKMLYAQCHGKSHLGDQNINGNVKG
jgi:hypothetical protein